MSKIAIIGPYPPPFGGVSIYMKRLSELLQSNNVKYEIIDDSIISNIGVENYKNINYKKLLLELMLNKNKYKILHFNSRNWKFIFLIIILNKIKSYKIVLTLHSFREDVSKISINTMIIKYVLRKVDYIISVSEEIQNKLKCININEHKTSIIPAFIPPKLDKIKIDAIKKKYFDKEIYTIVANASKLEFYNGLDLYGLDMCVELASILNKNGFKFKFIFVLSEINNQDYYKQIIARINEKKIEQVFEIVVSKDEFSYFLTSANMFIRSTNTDGDSVSVRESLYLDKITIASDIVARPSGVYTFKTRDIDSLSKVVQDNFIKKQNLKVSNFNEYKKILKIFNQYL